MLHSSLSVGVLCLPSIVVHKGSRSQSRPESPTGPLSAGMLPAVQSVKNALLSNATTNINFTNSNNTSEMLDENVNVDIDNFTTANAPHRPNSLPVPSCQPSPPDKTDTESNNYRNRTNTKVKLLVRSHAMRESTSPPREPHNNNGPMSPHSSQSSDGNDNIKMESKKFGNGTLSPNNTNIKLNNNETIYNSNLSAAQSPKQTRNVATSPTCRTPSRNGQSSPLELPKSNSTSPINNREKNDCQRTKVTNSYVSSNTNKCNNCIKNNHNDKPGLLQTPQSPSKSSTIQYSNKNINLPGQNGYQNNNNNNNNHHHHHHHQHHHRGSDNNRRSCNNQCTNQCSSNTLSVGNRTRHKLRHQNSSSQGSGSIDSVSPCLSRDSSTELYTDSTGIDLEQFIAVTINRNQKDRSVLLKIERELIEFAKDRQKSCHKFPNMSSYNRMLVHRVAAYFGMEHNVDQSGLSVIVTRTKNMRIPDTRFKEHIRDDLLLTEEPRRSILKRDSNSFEDGFSFKSPDRLSGDYCRRSKSFEEREVEYEKVRRRIFKDSSGESSELRSWPYWSSTESSDVSARCRLLHPSDHPTTTIRQTRLSKGESCDGRESFRGVLRPSVSKSFSFGGYTRGMLSRGDSVTSTRSASARLTKQDSGASVCSRLSPSSSGYKSQSQRSDTTISPSPSPSPIPQIPCNHIQSSSQNSTSLDVPQGNQTVMWAVSSISSVPPGSIIMNPRTNQPYTNTDGSIYRFDPDNPPKIFNDIAEICESPATASPEKILVSHESPRHSTPIKNYSKKHKNQNKLSANINGNNNINHHRVTNTATSPTLPFSTSPPSPPPLHECNQSTIKTNVESQSCVQTSINQSYTNCTQQNTTEITYGPPPPPSPPPPPPPPPSYQTVQQQNMIVQRHPDLPTATQQQQQQQQQQQPVAPPPDMVFGQNNIYNNYPMMTMQQTASHPQTNDVAELSGYFMGMNVYEQSRSANETSPSTPQYSVPPPPPPPPFTINGHHQHQHGQQMQSGYWQSPPPPPTQGQSMTHSHHHSSNPPPQQPMYFVPPTGNTMAIGQTPNVDRQTITPQRFASNYAYNPQPMPSPSQTTTNYVNGYPISYNSMPTVTPTPAEYSYQSPLPVIPTYYPTGQSGIQPPPVMWRVPTPPNTPTSNQIPGIPVMYVNSGGYPAPTMVATGAFGHQLTNTTATSPPGATTYMTPGILPNLVFRQNVPIVGGGIRASTPSGSQRTSRSPTPAYEFFNNGVNGGGNSGVGCGGSSGDNRNAQVPTRYPLPMYQGVHIVQGDIRLMHPGVANNTRIQYAPVPSPPVVQGCPRPFRPPSYSSNNSGCPTPNSYDGRNQKIRKQRSKVTTLPPTGARSNVYQVPSVSSNSSNPPKDTREGTVKVTITRQNHLVQY